MSYRMYGKFKGVRYLTEMTKGERLVAYCIGVITGAVILALLLISIFMPDIFVLFTVTSAVLFLIFIYTIFGIILFRRHKRDIVVSKYEYCGQLDDKMNIN